MDMADSGESRRVEAQYDVVVVADFSAGGDQCAELATEIRAQAMAGYTTALAPLGSSGGAFDQRVAACVRAGLARVLSPGQAASARLLVLRLPPGLPALPEWRADVTAERVVVVHELSHVRDPTVPPAIDAHLRTRTGLAAEWIAISEAARHLPGGARGPGRVWSPVVDVVSGPRPAPVDGRATIVWYRSGAGAASGSAESQELLRRQLAGHAPVRDLDGSTPTLVSDVDVLVSPDAPDAAELPDRVLLEAVAAGAVVVLPPAARPVFGDAVVYARPSAVVRAVSRVLNDADEWARRSRAALAGIAERYGADRHVERIRELAGAPSSTPQAPGVAAVGARHRRVMFVSSNGGGVGHLTRLLAIARRLPDGIEPVFFTMSQAVSVVRRMGYPCEHLASAGYAGMDSGTWNRHLHARLVELVTTYGPEAVVFDGTQPYRGLLGVAEAQRHVPFVWSRRAMWKDGVGDPALLDLAHRRFRMVIEPGELAEDVDRGLTVGFRDRTDRIEPVTLLDRSEILSRDDARAELGLDPARPAVLVQLGAGIINDTVSVAAVVHQQLHEVDDLQVCATSHPMARPGEPPPPDLHVVSVYPLSRYLAAFDFGVTAPGYNSFHEFVTFGVPAIFIANTETQRDDQVARGGWAGESGVGLAIEEFTPERFAKALEEMLDPGRREEMRRACEQHARPNGAHTAVSLLEQLLRADVPAAPDATGARGAPVRSSAVRLVVAFRARVRRSALLRRLTGRRPLEDDTEAPRSANAPGRPDALPVPAGSHVAGEEAAALPVALLLCFGATAEELERVVERVVEIQVDQPRFRPLFVVDSDHFGAFRRHDFAFEYVVPREDWESLSHASDWPVYLERRVNQIAAAFRPGLVADLSPVPGPGADAWPERLSAALTPLS